MHRKILVLLLFPVLLHAQSNRGTTNKVTRYFYDDKVTSVEIWYGSDNKRDSVKTYHSNGKLNEVFYYDEKGLRNSYGYQYDMQGDKRVTWNFLHGKLLSRVDDKLPFNKDSEETMTKILQRLTDLNAKTNYNPVKIEDVAKRGYLRARLGNTSLAIEDLKKVEFLMNKISKKTTIVPDSVKAKREKFKSGIYDMLGNLYMSFEMENHAFHYFYKAMAAASDDYRILYNFANCLQNRKQNDLALFYLEKILKEKPQHGHARWSIAKLYSDLGQYEKAMENINVAFTKEKTIIEHSSGYGGRDLRTTRGLLYHKLGDSEKGIQDLKAVLEMDKNNSYALKNLGIIYLDQKKNKEACELFQKAKELNYSLIFDENDLEPLLESACNNVIPEIVEKKKPFVFPNPAVSSVSIEDFSSEKFSYALFDFESNPVLNGNTTNGTIDISSLASGFYILKVSTEGVSETFKVIKQ